MSFPDTTAHPFSTILINERVLQLDIMAHLTLSGWLFTHEEESVGAGRGQQIGLRQTKANKEDN